MRARYNRSKRSQKRNQIGFFLSRQRKAEPAFVKVNDVQQRLGGAVMKVRSPRRKSAQHRTFNFSDVIEPAVDQGLPEIAGRDALRCVLFSADGNLRKITQIETALGNQGIGTG